MPANSKVLSDNAGALHDPQLSTGPSNSPRENHYLTDSPTKKGDMECVSREATLLEESHLRPISNAEISQGRMRSEIEIKSPTSIALPQASSAQESAPRSSRPGGDSVSAHRLAQRAEEAEISHPWQETGGITMKIPFSASGIGIAQESVSRNTGGPGSDVRFVQQAEGSERGTGRERSSKKSRQHLERENSNLKEQINRLRGRLAVKNQRDTQIGHLTVQNIVIGQETMSTPLFGLAADLTSTGDVRRMMEDLNDEVFQTAAGLTDFEFPAQAAHVEGRSEGSVAELRSGSALVLGDELLRRYADYHDQLELQEDECLGRGQHRFTEHNVTMTQKQLIQRASSSDLAVSLIHAITDILLLTRPDAKESRSRKAIEAGFGDRLKSVVHLVLALNRAIGADAVSEGLEAVFVEPGARFEPNMMETSYPEDGPGGARDSVVCTTAVGLRKKGRSAGADRDGKTMMVMKPKVLLSSTLLVLME